jgi:uncharacterized protein DUF3168
MSVSVAFQTLVVDTLKADHAVMARVGANIFDSVPTKRPYPCIEIGASDFSPEYGEGLVARTESLQLDVWHQDQGRLNPCKATVDAVYTALHDVDLALPDPYALVRVHVSLVRVFRDADGISAHGVVQVEADLETH